MDTNRIGDELYFLRVCRQAGLIGGGSTRDVLKAIKTHGQLGGATAVAAAKHPNHDAIIDERGAMTFATLDLRVNALANSLAERGVTSGTGVALLARNHRGLVEALFACAKLGARIVLLNTDFAGPQIRDVAEREGAKLLICDAEYAPLLGDWQPELGRILAWPGDEESLDDLIATGSTEMPPKPEEHAHIVILTSGTTGKPKGAPRQESLTLAGPGGLLSKVPFRSRETTVIATPVFHSLGFAHMVLAILLGSTIVMRRRFDPRGTLEDCARTQATALIAVPVMLRRIVDLGDDVVRSYDLDKLRIVFVSGSQLGGDLCRRLTWAFGPVLYNLYGSTEVAYATFATPADLAAAPDTVGTPPRGTRVRIVDENGNDVPTGRTGRIFVGNPMTFEGYTSGENKELLSDGLMSSGDVGHLDAAGRLFIDGRDDDMIVSGGENVFPQEVEELLDAHPAVREVAVVGVPDEKFGQRLAAFVVRAEDSLDEDAVRDHVREHLARYKIPRDVVFVDALPRNPTGKVLKRELRERVPESASA
jgi:fatty-acyl-CoA synthase